MKFPAETNQFTQRHYHVRFAPEGTCSPVHTSALQLAQRVFETFIESDQLDELRTLVAPIGMIPLRQRAKLLIGLAAPCVGR
jgi:hypothetical protein